MSSARAEIEISASDSKLGAGLARARAKFSEFSGAIARGMGKAMSGAASAVKWVNKKTSPGETTKHAIGEFAGNMVTRGVDGLIGAAEGVRNFERSLVRYQIVANKTPESMKAFRDQVRQVSRDTGISSDAVLAGSQAYLDLTGDVAGAEKQMATFARVAQASDSSMSDVTTLAAALQDSMHVDPSQMEAVMSGLINQGKAGAVTMKDMAGEFTGLLPRFARFGELGVKGTNILGAMFQVGRKGFKSAEETGTGMAAMLGGLVKHADRFHKAGVEVFDIGKDGTKTLRPISKIIEEIGTSKLAKDPQLLNKAFGRGEGEQIYQMLSGHVDLLRQMEEAGKDAGAVQRDLATFTTSDAGRMDLAFNRLKETIAAAFTPERITGFTNAVEALADRLGPVIDAVGKIGDAVGGIYGAGQKVRGFLSGNENNNPFVEGNGMDEAKKYADAMDSDPEKQKRKIQALVMRSKNKGTYDTAVESIMGGQVNDRSSPESIRRAVFAKYNTREAGQGQLGEASAGQAYLTNAGIDNSKAAELLAKYQSEAADKVAKAIRDGLVTGLAAMAPPAMNVDSTKVDKAVAKGSVHARRGGT